MAFELKDVVPWGRNLEEYRNMFDLIDLDLNKKIISFGDGPASFNYEMMLLKRNMVSLDLIYLYSKDELQERINKTKNVVLEQTLNNSGNYVWKDIKKMMNLKKSG